MNEYQSISFCITCKNRLYQIRQTLRKNLDDNILHDDFIEFILVDFGSNDGLREWIVDNFQKELTSGYLKYYYTEELPLWHASIAKNTAHLCASGNILVNLDCDNFTGPLGGAYVMKIFAQIGDQCVVHQFSGNFGDGSFGRIAVKKKYFDMLGGYDESLDPMGHQDYDLIRRLIKMGLKYVLRTDSRYNAAIPNSKEEGIAHTGSSKSYIEMLQHNENISFRNLLEGRLIANDGKFGIRKNIFDHNRKKFYLQKILSDMKKQANDKTSKTISIVMPAYNAENCIAEAIGSILVQSFTDFELIIIDDGSTDNTKQIVLSFFDPRIILVENKHDFTDSLNVGIKMAKGKYIARMDADDKMFPERLQLQYDTMEKYPEITVCSSWVQLFNNKVTGTITKMGDGFINNVLLKLLNGPIVSHPTTMIRKKFLLNNNLKYEDYPYAEDYKLWFEIAKKGGVFYSIPKPLLYYRISENQVSYICKIERQETSQKIRREVSDYLVSENASKYQELSIINDNILNLLEKKLIDEAFYISAIKDILMKLTYQSEIKNSSPNITFKLQSRSVIKTTGALPISVIMPVYNGEKYIKESIESILNQSFENFEFIIINDCSIDETINIIKSFNDPRIILLNNESREGNYKSRNKGLKAGSGKYICVMDADDISVPERFEKQYRFMEENPKYAVAGADIKFFSDNSFPTSFEGLRNIEEIKVELLNGNVCIHPTLIMCKDILLQNNIYYDENYYYSADYNLLADISRIGSITNIPEYLLYYRNHSEQISFAKRNEQELYKKQIQLNQLIYFKIRPSIDEIIIHQNLINGYSMSPQQLETAEKWCNKLIVKNHKLKLYNEEYFYNFLEKKISVLI